MLVLLIALTLTATAMAIDGYSITITANSDLPAMTDGQFTARQIFTGTLNADTPNNRQLANIKWGSGVNWANLVTALKSCSDTPENIKEAFKAFRRLATRTIQLL